MSCIEFRRKFRLFFFDLQPSKEDEIELGKHLAECLECREWQKEFYKEGLKP
jgi:predicted anti-sigma-YlaC factor YlaD